MANEWQGIFIEPAPSVDTDEDSGDEMDKPNGK